MLEKMEDKLQRERERERERDEVDVDRWMLVGLQNFYRSRYPGPLQKHKKQITRTLNPQATATRRVSAFLRRKDLVAELPKLQRGEPHQLNVQLLRF